MRRLNPILQTGRRALSDIDLLKLLQSEIKHELSSSPFQSCRSGSLGDFTVDWDSTKSKDVVLQKKYNSGEEVAVSALLGPQVNPDVAVLPRVVFMKVCVKKPGLKSVLQFDCGIYEKGNGGSHFNIHNAYYLQSNTCKKHSAYRGPLFSELDPKLQDAFKEYLVAKGISESMTDFLLFHLHNKEQGQYVNWLHKLESFVKKENE